LDEAVRQAANGQASLSLMGMVATGFMRITSNPKVFKQTDPLADACDFIDSLLSCPGVQLQTQSASWPNMRQLCLTQQIKGDLILGCMDRRHSHANW
jgi:hypothetical protein